ncbi:MAG: hypothetical protein M3297_07115 [Thermoproteota archaeon]|nr:hypothetical protein [Thermoproteota archaeon]
MSEEIEPTVTSIQHNIAAEVELRHTPELRGVFRQLAKERTNRFTFYNTTETE